MIQEYSCKREKINLTVGTLSTPVGAINDESNWNSA